VAYSPTGDRIAAVNVAEPVVTFWNPETGEKMQEFRGLAGSPMCLDFSDDGRRLAAADSTGMAVVWDAATGEPLSTLRAPPAPMILIQIRADGITIDTASMDGIVRTWKLAD
jgi:WD40 repeat protein